MRRRIAQPTVVAQVLGGFVEDKEARGGSAGLAPCCRKEHQFQGIWFNHSTKISKLFLIERPFREEGRVRDYLCTVPESNEEIVWT